ncbi:MAG: HAD family hydrolase [Anaerolineae bacterium]
MNGRWRMSVQAIIFDFGGVLVRTEDQTGRLRAAARLGVSPEELYAAVFDSPAAAQATLGQAPAEAVWAHVQERFGLDADGLARLRADFWAGDRLDETLVAFIRRLRPARKIGILSNAWSDGRRIIAEKFGLAHVVDDIVISAEVGIAKPDARIFRLAAARLGVEPGQVIFVDDFSANIAGARAVGMHAVHFRSADQTIADVRALIGE